MLKLYSPVLEPNTSGGRTTVSASKPASVRCQDAPSTAEQILFLLENVSCFKSVRQEAVRARWRVF